MNLRDFRILFCRDHSNFVNCVRFSPDGTKFISVSSDKKGILFDGKSGEKIGELSSEENHKGSIYAVSWSPDSKQVSVVSAYYNQSCFRLVNSYFPLATKHPSYCFILSFRD